MNQSHSKSPSVTKPKNPKTFQNPSAHPSFNYKRVFCAQTAKQPHTQKLIFGHNINFLGVVEMKMIFSDLKIFIKKTIQLITLNQTV